MRWMAAIGMAALALAGCAHGRDKRGGETISYSATACFGSCPIYTVTLGPDGQGIFEGARYTAARGERRFQATPAQMREFTRQLAAVRPRQDRVFAMGTPGCEPARTDAPGIDVRWQGTAGAVTLRAYGGCGGKDGRETYDALRRAAGALPIADYVGGR
jgi:hypothetical protein